MEEILDSAVMSSNEDADATIDVVFKGAEAEPFDILMAGRQQPVDTHPRKVIERPRNSNFMLEVNPGAIDGQSLAMRNLDLGV
jgi:hypothetical protein